MMKWEEKYFRKDNVEFNVGDEVKVGVRVKEGDKERIQVFEGIVISRKGSGLNETFKVRKLSAGIGVERTFLLHSYAVANIKVTKMGKVRRAKLFYLRDKVGKDSRIKEEMMASVLPAEEPKKSDETDKAKEPVTPAANETK